MKSAISSGNAKQLTEILDSVADGITVQNAAGQLVFVNKAAAKIMGFEEPQAALRAGSHNILSDFDYFDEQGRPVHLTELPGRKALQGEEEPAMIVGYKTAVQPAVRWSSIKAMPVYAKDGSVEFAVNVIQDITQLKEIERQLREANERITKLLEQALEID